MNKKNFFLNKIVCSLLLMFFLLTTVSVYAEENPVLTVETQDVKVQKTEQSVSSDLPKQIADSESAVILVNKTKLVWVALWLEAPERKELNLLDNQPPVAEDGILQSDLLDKLNSYTLTAIAGDGKKIVWNVQGFAGKSIISLYDDGMLSNVLRFQEKMKAVI